MLKGIYDEDATDGKNMELYYPTRAKLPREVLTVKDFAHAERVWTIRTKKYIFETLRGWTMQRKHAIAYSENNFKLKLQGKNAAIDKLVFALMSHYESSLFILTMRVLQHKSAIENIAPSTSSKLYNHYKEVILPIVEWCDEYQTAIKKQKQLN